ncbi:FadR/GntR family transcriptional regulator [Agreia sp. COWG]|uniref:FadR/GntR family transcriptional regulator n=1 Tax=Agreia sp. COWG TaxID=2773266 RepID=UPI001926540E|nr:FadR/GntR family transcriptional regulator [Agreia sp. COWG]CAD5995097.1 HTH gntR-type domain-containing protein [Agreia sp. COWG]
MAGTFSESSVKRPGTLSAGIASHLEQRILDGELQPGERMPPERELAKSLGVSRASLREAMHELEAKKLIERRQGRGTTVSAPSADGVALRDELSQLQVELRNAAEVRDVVEPTVAYLAARRRAASNILRLEETLSKSNEFLDVDESLRLDVEFHLALAHAAQNPLLTTLVTMTSEWTMHTRRHSHATRAGRRSSIAGHRAVLDALLAGDPDAARRAMEEHLADVKRLVEDEARP